MNVLSSNLDNIYEKIRVFFYKSLFKRELSKQNTLCLVVKYIWFSYSRKLHLGTHLQSIIYVRHFLILFWLFVQVFWTFFKISLIKLSWRVKRRLSLHGMFYTLFKSFQQWNVAKVHYDGFSRINHICEYKHRTRQLLDIRVNFTA